MAALHTLARERQPLLERLIRRAHTCAVTDCAHQCMKGSQFCALHRFAPWTTKGGTP